MKNPLSQLQSIFDQASNNNNPQQFFQLLHEFTIALQNPIFSEALQQIRAREQSMKHWIKKITHESTPEFMQLYYQQYRAISTWFALNQIMVFWERYDFALHDATVRNLTIAEKDADKLQNEHHELMKYAITGICPPIFPTIEEYKQYMRRVINALDDISMNSTSTITTHAFRFDKKSNTLLIEGYNPILFARNKNTSVLLGFLEEKKWKPVKRSAVSDNLNFDHETTKRTIRQINDRLPAPLPQFLTLQDHPAELNEKAIIITGVYKRIERN